jgi:hypothetical protein
MSSQEHCDKSPAHHDRTRWRSGAKIIARPGRATLAPMILRGRRLRTQLGQIGLLHGIKRSSRSSRVRL